MAKHKLKAVPSSLTGFSFARPSNAVRFRSSANLFTIPGCDGILFKEVSSLAEIEDLQGGIAYSTADGSSLYAFVGYNMSYPLLPSEDQATNPTSAAKWPANGSVMSYVPGFVPTGVANGIKIGQTQFAQAYGCLISPTADMVTVSECALKEQTGVMSINSGSPGGTPHPRIFAVVCRADAGFLVKNPYDPRTTGWMSTLVAFGDMLPGMFGAYEDIVATCDPKLIGAFNAAFTAMKAEGQFSRKPKLGLVTYWGGSRSKSGGGCKSEWPESVQFGGAFSFPSVTVNTVNSAAKTYTTFATASAPSFAFPNMNPVMAVFDPPSVPREIKSGVAAWHRMAKAAESDGSFYAIDVGNANPEGWNSITTPLQLLADSRTVLNGVVAAGVPTDSVALSLFKPSISKEENFDGFKRLFFSPNSLISGDYVSSFDEKVKALYLRAEAEVG